MDKTSVKAVYDEVLKEMLENKRHQRSQVPVFRKLYKKETYEYFASFMAGCIQENKDTYEFVMIGNKNPIPVLFSNSDEYPSERDFEKFNALFDKFEENWVTIPLDTLENLLGMEEWSVVDIGFSERPGVSPNKQRLLFAATIFLHSPEHLPEVKDMKIYLYDGDEMCIVSKCDYYNN